MPNASKSGWLASRAHAASTRGQRGLRGLSTATRVTVKESPAGQLCTERDGHLRRCGFRDARAFHACAWAPHIHGVHVVLLHPIPPDTVHTQHATAGACAFMSLSPLSCATGAISFACILFACNHTAGEGVPRVVIVGGGFGGLYTAVRLGSLFWPKGKTPQARGHAQHMLGGMPAAGK